MKMVPKNKRSILLHSPPEILDEILLYLSPRDIRKLRSVCKYLNEKLYDFRFCENEIVVWRNICDTRKMIEAVTKSNRSLWHLLIEDVCFIDNSLLRFFQEQGHRVNSLSLTNCHLPYGLLATILVKCDALRSFSFVITKDFNPRQAFDDFSTLELNSVVRPDVRNFKLVVNKKNWLPDSVFRLFFAIFPNVKRLHLEIDMCKENRQSNSPLSLILARTPVTYTTILLSILKVKSNLESLSWQFPVSALQIMNEFVIASMPNLNHLSLGCQEFYWSQMVNQLGRCREHLQNDSSLEIPQLRFGIRTLPELLRRLQPMLVASLDSQRLTHVEFAALVKSKLRFIEIRITKLNNLSVHAVRHQNLQINESVKDLTLLNTTPVRLAKLFLFPEYFRGLVHLRLENVWNALLQTILKYLVNLKSLYIGDCRACNIEGFIGMCNPEYHYSIGDLQNLEHLTLIGLRTSILNSQRFKSRFRFPRLKYLNIQCCHKDGRHNSKVPVKFFESFVHLEALKLTNFANPSHSLLSPLFKKLFRLRYFRCEGFDVLNENVTFVDLSEFAFNDLNLVTTEDFYDKKSNKIIFINRQRLGFRFFSPKISSFVIDWIEF